MFSYSEMQNPSSGIGPEHHFYSIGLNAFTKLQDGSQLNAARTTLGLTSLTSHNTGFTGCPKMCIGKVGNLAIVAIPQAINAKWIYQQYYQLGLDVMPGIAGKTWSWLAAAAVAIANIVKTQVVQNDTEITWTGFGVGACLAALGQQNLKSQNYKSSFAMLAGQHRFVDVASASAFVGNIHDLRDATDPWIWAPPSATMVEEGQEGLFLTTQLFHVGTPVFLPMTAGQRIRRNLNLYVNPGDPRSWPFRIGTGEMEMPDVESYAERMWFRMRADQQARVREMATVLNTFSTFNLERRLH